jgi:hypothetical protein
VRLPLDFQIRRDCAHQDERLTHSVGIEQLEALNAYPSSRLEGLLLARTWLKGKGERDAAAV